MILRVLPALVQHRLSQRTMQNPGTMSLSLGREWIMNIVELIPRFTFISATIFLQDFVLKEILLPTGQTD